MLEKIKIFFEGELGSWRDCSVTQNTYYFTKDPSLVPSTHVRWLTATVTQATRNPRPSASLPRHTGVIPMHTNKIKLTSVLKKEVVGYQHWCFLYFSVSTWSSDTTRHNRKEEGTQTHSNLWGERLAWSVE